MEKADRPDVTPMRLSRYSPRMISGSPGSGHGVTVSITPRTQHWYTIVIVRYHFREHGFGALDRGGLADPAGDEHRIASGVERGAVPRDLGVAVNDDVAELRCLVVLLMLGERGAVAGVGDAAPSIRRSDRELRL